jgi:hypothetical protein
MSIGTGIAVAGIALSLGMVAAIWLVCRDMLNDD